ncbi:macro domain-containing protein [Desulfovibrio sp. OttesenSCG-928-C14]|nr:macro domain-containing protein [Desulfovibrio sp. OttesenSCG-928-C14]
MIDIVKGNILKCDAEALVNTVNTQGVMGKGIALQFSKAYPAMFTDYSRAYKNGELAIGVMHVFETQLLHNPKYIINFPTKAEWRKPSKQVYIEEGLKDLLRVVAEKNISSIAIPPLGCGLGGLRWPVVRELIEFAFSGLPNVQVWLFEPGETPSAQQMVNNTARPKLTVNAATILLALRNYSVAGYESSWLEVQKLLYFLQISGQKLNLSYEKGRYGPYADNLRHLMNRLENHYLTGFGDGTVSPMTQIRLLPGAADEAAAFLEQSKQNDSSALNKVTSLIDGFESPYGLELLATVHWLIDREAVNKSDFPAVVKAVHSWNKRKAAIMKPEHIRIALQRLSEQAWV